jgi:hypothetical protein
MDATLLATLLLWEMLLGTSSMAAMRCSWRWRPEGALKCPVAEPAASTTYVSTWEVTWCNLAFACTNGKRSGTVCYDKDRTGCEEASAQRRYDHGSSSHCENRASLDFNGLLRFYHFSQHGLGVQSAEFNQQWRNTETQLIVWLYCARLCGQTVFVLSPLWVNFISRIADHS